MRTDEHSAQSARFRHSGVYHSQVKCVYAAQHSCDLCLQMQTAAGILRSPEVVCIFIPICGTTEKNPYFLLPAWTTCDWECHRLSVRVAAVVWIHTELQVSENSGGEGGDSGGQRTGMLWTRKRDKRSLVKGGDSTPQTLREFCEWWKSFDFVFDFIFCLFGERISPYSPGWPKTQYIDLTALPPES